jgi:hypothetical protein
MDIEQLKIDEPEVTQEYFDVILSRMLANSAEEFMQGFGEGVDPRAYDEIKECIHDIPDETLDRIRYDVTIFIINIEI